MKMNFHKSEIALVIWMCIIAGLLIWTKYFKENYLEEPKNNYQGKIKYILVENSDGSLKQMKINEK